MRIEKTVKKIASTLLEVQCDMSCAEQGLTEMGSTQNKIGKNLEAIDNLLLKFKTKKLDFSLKNSYIIYRQGKKSP